MSFFEAARKLAEEEKLKKVNLGNLPATYKKTDTTTKDTKTDTKKTTTETTSTKKTTTEEPWTLKTADEKKATEKSSPFLDAAWKLSGKERPSGAKYSSAPSSSKKSSTSDKTETKKTSTKTTITSNLTEEERKKRIKEINSELNTLNSTLSGYSRAKVYGTNKAMADAEKKTKERIAELSSELKTLERVGTFTQSELKQFEIDDAKAKRAALPTFNPTGRISLADADTLKASVSARSELDKEITRLEAEKAEYKKIEKLDELNAETKKITSKGDFEQNSKYSPRAPKTEAELKAEGYKQNESGTWVKVKLGLSDYYTGEDSDLYTYLNKRSERSRLEKIAMAQYGRNTYEDLGYHTLTDEEIGAFNYLYHQDRKNGTNTAEKYLQTISPLLQERAMEEDAKYYKEVAKEHPVASSVYSLGTNLGNAMMFPTKAIATATGIYDDIPSLDLYGNRTQAIRGAVSEDMGTVGKLAYNAGMSIGDMGTAMLIGGGNGRLVQAIMSSSAGSSTISEAKKNGASDGKALVLGLGSAAIEWATEKYSIEALLKEPKTILSYIGTNILTEGTEEGASNLANIALDTIISEVFNEPSEIEQRIGYLMLNEGMTYEEAFETVCLEKLQSLGEDVLVGALTGAGMSTVASSPAIVEKGIEGIRNRSSVNTTQETNTATNPSVTPTKAVNVPNGQRQAPATLEQAARDVVASRNRTSGIALLEDRKKGKVTADMLNTLTQANVEITKDEVKKVTGFGDIGSELVANYSNIEGATFNEVADDLKPSYIAGFNNPELDIKKVAHTFNSPAQEDAYTAGQIDGKMQAMAAEERAKTARVYDGAFTENEYTKNFSRNDRTMISTVAKSLKMDVSVVDKIIANVVNGRVYEANAEHQNGKMRISSTTEKVIHELVMHEGGHRMRQLAPTEFGVLMNALYERAERRAATSNTSGNLIFDNVKAEHDNAGIVMDTSGYLEEFAVRELETIFGSAREFNKFYAEISGNQQVRTNFEKFVDWVLDVIDEIKRALKQAKMSKEERAAATAELDRIKELYANAYKAAEKAATERAKAKNTEAKAETTTKAEKQPVASVNESTDIEAPLAKKNEPQANISGKITNKTKNVLGQDVSKRVVGVKDGRAYVSNGKIAIPIEETDVAYAKSEWGLNDSDKIASFVEETINNNEFVPISSNPIEGKMSTLSLYVFTTEDGREIAIQKRYAQYLDGYNLSATFVKGKPYAIKATDADGNLAGLVMAAQPMGRKTYELTDTKDVSMKSFKNKSVEEGTTKLNDEEMHIDNRTWEDVGNRQVKAFQFLYPEFKEYYTPLAQELLGDLKNTIKGERIKTGSYEMGNEEWTGVSRYTSDAIARIKDATNATYDDIENALKRLINDEGQENIALAKRIELVFDEMLSEGYTTFDGMEIPADEDYIAKKEALLGKSQDNKDNEVGNTDDEWDWLFDSGKNFSLKNKNLTIKSLIPFTTLDNYIAVAQNDSVALGNLESAVQGLKRGAYTNDATGYSAKITGDTINKAIRPARISGTEYTEDHIRNLNAMIKLPELFKKAVYVDSKPPQKVKNQKKAVKEYHHFVAPVLIGNDTYRALITAREKINSNTLYVLQVEVLPMKKRHTLSTAQQKAGGSRLLSVPSNVSIPELVKDVKIYNYDTGITDVYSGKDIKFSLKDSEYLKLAKDPKKNEARLRELVDEAAKAAGYIGTYYHGSKSDFTIFKKERGGASNSNAGIGFWFTETEEGAKKWADEIWWGDNEESKVYKTYLRLNNPKVYETVDTKAQRDELYKGYENFDKEMSLYDSIYYFEDGRRYHTERYDYDKSKRRSSGVAEWDAFKAIVKKYDADTVDYYLSKVPESERQTVKRDAERYLELSKERKALEKQMTELRYSDAYELFRTDMYKQIGLGAEDANIGGTGRYVENKDEMLKKYVDMLRQEEYDGIKIKNTSYDAYSFGDNNNQYLVFDSNQVKSAETVTYDDNGNVIPLSERFNKSNDDIRYSLKDSEGKALTKEQQEYFKDTKVRDENGNLLIVYHGSPSKFTVFNHKYLNVNGNSHGRGFYFTEKRSLAEGYERKSGQLLKGYLNITNPLSEDKVTIKKADFLKLVKATCKQEAQEFVNDGEYDSVSEALRDTWISNYVNTYETSMDNAYREVANSIYSANTNDVELIAELTNAGRSDIVLRLTHDILGYDGVIYTAKDGTHEFVSLVSEQFKSIDNTNPTSNPDINFSLKGGMSATEFFDTIDDARKGKKKAVDRLSKYVDDGIMSTEVYNQLIEEFGAIPTGEKPYRDVQVPVKTEKNKKVSQTVRTILEAEVTPDEAVPTIEKMVEDGVFSYDAYTDKEAIENGENYIKEHGWEESLIDWFDAVNSGEVSKDITTTGWILYNHAATTAATATDTDAKKSAATTAVKILDAMVRHQRSAAQALQATRILKKLSPEAQLYGVQKSVQAFQEELKKKYGKKAPDLKIDDDLAEQFLNAKTEEERTAVEVEIYKDIGRQMPSNWLDKWNAWRYIAMLTNPRTHVRNILGNALFAPVVATKNLTATAIESIVAPVVRWSGKEMVRGKSLVWGNKADRALLKAAWADYANVADIVSNGGKYNDSAMGNKHIEEGRRIFKGILTPIEWVRRGNSNLLEWEDMWFSKPHYAYALAQYCKANNITAEQISRGKAIAPAREYAIKEAQKATYKDTNAFSQMVSELGRGGKRNWATNLKRTLVEGALPFRKTPANILVRGVEYSPIGFIKGLIDLRKVGKEVDGKVFTASEAIDSISAGLTGSGLLALGIFLAAQGLIRGHGEDEEKEKEFNDMMGHQNYSLELPSGESITLDWLAPESLPFFTGVAIWEITKGKKEDVNFATILSSVMGMSDPMLEMSFLQGINDVLESVGYAKSNDMKAIPTVLSSLVTSYITQAVPTLFGQIERTSEEERMTTYTEKNSIFNNDMQYTLGKMSAKIPFWDYNQIPYIDAWGRHEASGSALKRGLNNFLNPAYTSTIETSSMEKELLRLYEQTGDGGVFPTRADKKFTVYGTDKYLTAEEYVRYATQKGQKSYNLVTDLVKSKAYKKLSDEEKVKAIKETYDYANQKAKESISRYEPETWVQKADEFGSNVGNYISFKTEVSGTKEDNGGKISKEEVADIILDMAQNDSETWKMYLTMYDSTGDMYAYEKGIEGEDYMNFLKALSEVDEPTKSGKYGTYTQAEVTKAVKRIDGLTRKEKADLWQSVNTTWKKNPFR